MIVDRPVDCGGLYDAKRHEMVDLMRTLNDGELATTVPATPAWSVHDVLSHVVGITADLNAQRFDVVDPDAEGEASHGVRQPRRGNLPAL